MGARETLAFVLCACLEGCGACEPNREPPTKQEASSPPAPLLSTSPSTGHAERPPARRVPCRAITVEGQVTVERQAAPPLAVIDAYDASGSDASTPLQRAAEIPAEGWVSLASASRLVVKDPRTTRETTLRGPGLARVCVDLAEEVWLWSGTFESTPGSGETPGAEEWIVTPLGVVRFGAAALDVGVSAGARAVQVSLSRGTAFVWAARDATLHAEAGDAGPRAAAGGGDSGGAGESSLDEGWFRVSTGELRLFPAGPRQSRPPDAATAAGAKSAVLVCARMGKSARELAESVLAGDADGTAAHNQVTARRLARAACAIAALRVELLPPHDDKASLASSLADADALWRTPPLLR